jgi:hypothetical protein
LERGERAGQIGHGSKQQKKEGKATNPRKILEQQGSVELHINGFNTGIDPAKAGRQTPETAESKSIH